MVNSSFGSLHHADWATVLTFCKVHAASILRSKSAHEYTNSCSKRNIGGKVERSALAIPMGTADSKTPHSQLCPVHINTFSQLLRFLLKFNRNIKETLRFNKLVIHYAHNFKRSQDFLMKNH